jgi:hypothetical protein
MKKQYQPVPQPVVYMVPIASILKRLSFIPVRDHSTICAVRNSKKELFENDKCEDIGCQGTNSKATQTRDMMLASLGLNYSVFQ